MVLTLTQSLQLAGLAPCLFIILFLAALLPHNRQALVPIAYFSALACSFALPLLNLHPALADNRIIAGGLLLGESTLPVFCFLLVYQFMTGRVPPWPYWLILALPLVGGNVLIYASLLHDHILQGGDACIKDQTCLDIDAIKTLYTIFSASVVFLLLVYYSARWNGLRSDDIHKRHKYWLIIALILSHLLVLALDLARLAGHITPDQAQFAATMLRLTFIYLVLTSLFRVFYPGMASHAILSPQPPVYDTQADLPYVEKIRVLLETDGIYRQMRLNRAGLADMAGIGEHHLSRIVNRHFSMNFNELINGYRIAEAKRRLRGEPTPITTIGFEVGFNSIASFNRVFKEKVGLSPTEYRNQREEKP